MRIIDVEDQLTRKSPYQKRDLSKIKGIVVHHDAGSNWSVYDIARYHVESRGWPGIGYHFFIDKGGNVYKCNDISSISYHTENNNTPYIGICFNGNFENEAPTEKQILSGSKLFKEIQFSLGRRLDIRFHNDFKATACPGRNFPKEYFIRKCRKNLYFFKVAMVLVLFAIYIRIR